MQDYTFLDDYDYTLCTYCHSSVQPYNNTSITTITSSTTIDISITNLKNTNSFTKTLLEYHHLHCQKCGLFIEFHPKHDDETSQKIFICSNNSNPHKYCLCYHCGLLYGINPNQKSIDIINTLKSQIENKNNENNKDRECLRGDDENERDEDRDHIINESQEENSLDREVDDDDDHSVDDDEESKTKIDESYMNLIALQTKLNLLSNFEINGRHQTVSCPTSPNIRNLSLKKSSSHSFKKWSLSHSLKCSPLLGPSTPSPRLLEKERDESEKKWHEYLLEQSKEKEKSINDISINDKLEKQQKKLDELEELQKQLSLQKKNSEQFAKLFKNGTYLKSKFEI